jgi:hypothetical protein
VFAKVTSTRYTRQVLIQFQKYEYFAAITFKQTSIHDLGSFNKIKLEDAVITFRLSFRNFKQKQPVSLGVAKFNFSSFEVTKNFACNQELTLRLSDNTPIVVGRDGKNNLHIDVLHHLMHRKHISMYSMYRNKKIDVLNTSIYFQGYNNLLELDIES